MLLALTVRWDTQGEASEEAADGTNAGTNRDIAAALPELCGALEEPEPRCSNRDLQCILKARHRESFVLPAVPELPANAKVSCRFLSTSGASLSHMHGLFRGTC